MQPKGHHLAEFNIGVLRYDWDDPRVADFVNGLDLVNGIAARSPGFVWRFGDADMEDAQLDDAGPLGGNPRTASTLSVWENVESLEAFVWKTVHKQFYDRKVDWFAPGQGIRMVLWWVPKGHRPTIAEAKARFDLLSDRGDSEDAFGWSYLQQARLWKDKQCEVAA